MSGPTTPHQGYRPPSRRRDQTRWRSSRIGTGLAGNLAGRLFFRIGQQPGLEDHLADRAAGVGHLRHRPDIAPQQVEIAGLERAHIHHHVHFASASGNDALGLERLDLGKRRAERKADHRAHGHISESRSRQHSATQAGLTHTEANRKRRASSHSDDLSRVTEQRVIDQPGDLGRSSLRAPSFPFYCTT